MKEQLAREEEKVASKLEEIISKVERNGQGIEANHTVLLAVQRDVKAVLGKINASLRTLSFLAQGETDCPHLFMITPAESSVFQPSSWLAKKMHLYFLCAYDFQAVNLDTPVVITSPTEFVAKALPAFKVSLQVVKGALIAGRVLGGLKLDGLLPDMDGLDAATQLLGQINAVKDAADKYVQDDDTDHDALDLLDSAVELGEKEDLDYRTRDTLMEAQKLSGDAYRAIADLARTQDVLKKLNMKKMVSFDGTVAWVKTGNAKAWAREGKPSAEASMSSSIPGSGGAGPSWMKCFL